MLKDFKAFIMRGNVVDMAVHAVLKEGTTPAPYDTLAAAQTAGAVTLNYGQFINVIITFLIIAAVVFFFIVRPIAQMNARQKAAIPAAASTTKECPFCLSQVNIKATRCPNCTSQLQAK
jgi:large conductance mechanosensitive channel